MSWILRDGQAHFSTAHWIVNVALDGNAPGIEIRSTVDNANLHLTATIEPHDQSLAQVMPPLKAADAYVRQNDLVASFPEVSPWRFGYQMDVKKVDIPESHDSLCLEVWLSVQTSLLDSHPRLSLRFPNEHLESKDTSFWLGSSQRAGIAIHPVDRADCEIKNSKDEFNLKAFGRFMEKGVIRRMRFRWIATTHAQPAEFWQRRCEEFLNSPLPLNT